jgi:hypothetical protein
MEYGDNMFLRNVGIYYESILRHKPEEQQCHPHHRNNLKSHKVKYIPEYKQSWVHICIGLSSLSSYGCTAQFGPWPPFFGFPNNNLFTGLDC